MSVLCTVSSILAALSLVRAVSCSMRVTTRLLSLLALLLHSTVSSQPATPSSQSKHKQNVK